MHSSFQLGCADHTVQSSSFELESSIQKCKFMQKSTAQITALCMCTTTMCRECLSFQLNCTDYSASQVYQNDARRAISDVGHTVLAALLLLFVSFFLHFRSLFWQYCCCSHQSLFISDRLYCSTALVHFGPSSLQTTFVALLTLYTSVAEYSAIRIHANAENMSEE